MRVESREVPESLKVFISSKDILNDERSTIEKAVKDLKLLPLRTESNTWVATRYFDEYIRQTRDSDIVILLLEEDNSDVTDFDAYYKYVAEEVDVAFSEGKAILLFVKRNNKNEQFNTFLESIQHKVFSRNFNNCVELYNLVQASILNELFRKYKSKPLFIENRKQLYEYCSKFLSRSQFKCLICENTPSFLLGPRVRIGHELEYYKSVTSLIERVNKNTSELELVLIYNIDKTMQELQKNLQKYDKKIFRKNCALLKNNGNQRVKVVGADDEIITFFVSDHTYIIGQHISRRAVILIDNSPEIVKELERLTDFFTADTIDQGVIAFEKMLDSAGL